jgi:phytoene dehydrogenase-like protein
MYDVIVIGAGAGGLTCAATLAHRGYKVLVLEKIHHIGGTSQIFKRGDYFFPMGPLSFSFPNLIKEILMELRIDENIQFTRNHFQLISPDIDIIYSQQWNKFKKLLKKQYREDSYGIDEYFDQFQTLIKSVSKVHEWHPELKKKKKKEVAERELLQKHKSEYEIIEKYNSISSKELLNKFLSSETLIKLLGSQGTYLPVMNMIHLAFMWNVMSFEGIWFPSCGIHGINEKLYQSIVENGGQVKLNTPVKKIIVEECKAKGVITHDDQTFEALWIVANADYKKVFLNFIRPEKLPKEHLEAVKNTAYTGSEFCVYLGIDPSKVDLSKMRANHLFYRAKIEEETKSSPEDFENKEIEICLWSNKNSEFAPNDKKSLVLRVNMPYEHFELWRIGEKKRKDGYQKYKTELAYKLIATVEKILPGLKSAVEILEVATPLTYQDWGQRYKGSVAGWTRDIKKIRLRTKILTRNPINNLLMVGIYSVLEPFLGGYPVSIYTGKLAADLIFEQS